MAGSRSTVAHTNLEPIDSRVSDAEVRWLSEALRAAKRAHAAYIAELRQADVEQAENWSTWYAEYLLGVR